MCVELKEGFHQVVVWPGTTVTKGEEADFEKFIKDEFDVEAQYLEQIETKKAPDGTGGRVDLFFAVKGDISKFAVKRLQYGMRWLEDVLSEFNYDMSNPLYDKRVFQYLTMKE